MFSLTRWTPLDSVWQLSRDFDLFTRLFDQLHGRTRNEEEAGPAWLPAVETYSRDGELGVRVALPGVDPKDVHISVMDDVLTIKGERKVEETSKQAGYVRRELAYGTFERSLVLPEGVDASKARAKYTNGMLEVTMPAPLAAVPKRVEIAVEGEGQATTTKAA